MNPETQTIAITKEAIASMPVVTYPGTVQVIDSIDSALPALRELTRARMVGFDTETRPSFHKGQMHKVALMQLSTDSHCYLFRINKLGIFDAMKRFIENPDVMKIGLSVHDDFNVLHRSDETLAPQGFIDLQAYVRQFNIYDISLQKIYAIVFGEKISKHQRLTNWEADKLTPGQQAYAALDAWACLRLYRWLSEGHFDPEASPYIVDRSTLNPQQPPKCQLQPLQQ